MVESDDATGTWYRRIDDGSGVFLTASSAVKGVVGAGILTLSWSFCFSSFWPGLFFTVLMGALAGCTYYLLGMCSEATGEKEYSAIWAQLCGKDSAWVVDVAILLYCALSVVSYPDHHRGWLLSEFIDSVQVSSRHAGEVLNTCCCPKRQRFHHQCSHV